MLKPKNNLSAFTLVELAIVLVIVGLLVGGVLQGQELIHQARLRSVISDIRSFEAAVTTFRLKYNELPGDIRRGAAYGVNCPADTTCGAAGDNTAHTDCDVDADGADGDGNGNGTLEGSTCIAYIEFYSGEIANFWVHLANTLLVKGGYHQTDNCDEDTCGNVAGVNFPELSVGHGIVAASSGQGLQWVLGVSPNNGWTFSGLGGLEGASIMGDQFVPEDAFGLDSKMDDGRPNTGIVKAVSIYTSATGTFTDDAVGATDCTAVLGAYNLTYNNPVCTLKVKSSGG